MNASAVIAARATALSVLVLAAACSRGAPAREMRAVSQTEASQPPDPEPSVEPDRALEPMGREAEPSAGLTPVAHAIETRPLDPIAELLALDGSISTSVGGPNDGRVEGAVALPESGPGFRSNPRRPNATAIYGTVELVQALVRAAAVVDAEMPGSVLFINDLGFEHGGPIPHHGSHRAGRDADVLFYLLDRDGRPREPVGAFLDPRGRGYDFKDLADPRDDVLVRLDVPRTWRFVQALLEGPFGDQVQRIFVAEHLRAMLLAHAERSRAPRSARERFAEITCQPGYPHDDHLHIRLHCTPEDMARGCQDSPPIYPWRRAQLRALGLEPVISRPRPDRPRSPRVTRDAARARAGPLHSRVEQWLRMRDAWMRPPVTGRPYCR